MATRLSGQEYLTALDRAVDRMQQDWGSWRVKWGEVNRFQRNDAAITQTFDDGKLADYPTTFYRRDLLPVGERVAGSAIVLQMDSTTVVPPQHSFEADTAGNLIVRRADA